MKGTTFREVMIQDENERRAVRVSDLLAQPWLYESNSEFRIDVLKLVETLNTDQLNAVMCRCAELRDKKVNK